MNSVPEHVGRIWHPALIIDANAMVEPADVTELVLDPGHPGENDSAYIARRKELFALCRKHRLERLSPPFVDVHAPPKRNADLARRCPRSST